MNAAFADAFYFVALLNRADQHHARVNSFAATFRRPIVTTAWVLTEVAGASFRGGGVAREAPVSGPAWLGNPSLGFDADRAAATR